MTQRRRGQIGNVSRLAFWVGWIIPFSIILILMPLWKSIWAYMPIIGADVLGLSIAFFIVAAIALAAIFMTPRERHNLRFHLYFLMIFALIAAIMLLLNYYYNWDNIVWF